MRAIVLERPGEPLIETERPDPQPGPGQLLLRVSACAVCRTDLHLRDAEIEAPRLPLSSVTRSPPRRPTVAGSGFRGWAGPTASAATAQASARTCASTRASPGATSTAATPRSP